MKINDLIFRFPTQVLSRYDGICRVRTFVGINTRLFALLTDLEENTSSSVTNSIESLCDALIKRGIVTSECTFIEHYETSGKTFDVVTFNDVGKPSWSSLSQSEVEKLIDCDNAELTTLTRKVPRLVDEIVRLRNEINPLIDSPCPESSEIIKRRFDIESRMINKAEIATLVERAATEQDIQRLLKTDLSIFAEIYAETKDEYVCFSEFPVAGGAVDFVMFSGRSRMDITLIEIKGADFFLVNQGHYNKFASKLENAVDQIRERLRHIFENIAEFKSTAHDIRLRVEQGAELYNSLLGPYGKLQVDPNKDVVIRSIVIGGRTRDDYEESRKRYDFEQSFSPSIKIESWDTFLRKVQRN